MRRALDLFFALRPLHLIPAIALYGAGAAWARGAAAPAVGAAGATPLLSLVSLLLAVHAANSWRDREGDVRNRKGLALRRGLVGPADLARAGIACVALAVLLALLPAVGPPARALLCVAAALGAAYVTPRVALKERAGLDLASHAAGYGVVAFLLGAAAVGALSGNGPAGWGRALVAAIPYALGVAAVSVLTMIADTEGDEAAGQRTLAVRLGTRRSRELARGLAWGTAIAGLLAAELVPSLWGLAAAAWLEWGEAGGGPERVNRLAIALQLLFLALLAARAPWTGAVALLLGLAASAYGRVRFGEGYPLARVLGKGSG